MVILLAKIFSIFLASIAISKSYVDFRGRRESLQMFLFWTLTWFSIVLVALFPSIIGTLISGQAGVGVGTILGMALIFLFFLQYRMYVKLDRLEQKVTMLVQDIALREHRK